MTTATIFSDVDASLQNDHAGGFQTTNSNATTVLSDYIGKFNIQRNPMFHFDVTTLGVAGVVVSAADLILVNQASSTINRVYSVGLVTTASFTDTDANPSSTRLDVASNRASNTQTVNSVGATYTWNGLATVVQNWWSGAVTNYGLCLFADSYASDFSDTFWAHEQTGTGSDPYLSVTYTIATRTHQMIV